MSSQHARSPIVTLACKSAYATRNGRRYGLSVIFGKALGLACCLDDLSALQPAGRPCRAADAPPVLTGNDVVNPFNTVWTLVAAFLVFGMQVSFTMLEAGFCRSRETVNVPHGMHRGYMSVWDAILCHRLAFMFSEGNGWIGYHYFFLQDAPAITGLGDRFLPFGSFNSLRRHLFEPSRRGR